MIKKLLIVSSILVQAVSANADVLASTQSDGIYSFGPSCSSSGQWTAKALQATRTLISTAKSLASDVNCQGMNEMVQSLLAAPTQVAPTIDEQIVNSSDPVGGLNSDSANQTQSKLTALSSVALSSDPSLQPFSVRAGHAYTKEALQSAITSQSMGQRRFDIARGRFFQYASSARDSIVSANALTQLANALPSFQSCLIGRPGPDMGLILSSVVGLGAAIAGNSSGPAPATSSMVQSILALVHNSKFASAISSLKQEQFTQSLSCLMEVSTESYCSVLDMQNLIKSPALNEKSIKAKVHGNAKNALSGYNILTVHLPNIYQWAQQVQFGVAPRTSADAAFGNDAVNLVSSFQTRSRTLPTFLWEAEKQLMGQNSAGRKTTLINAIRAIATLIEQDPMSVISSTNFFFQTQNRYVLPFYLLDEGNNVPPCVFSTSGGNACDPYAMLNTPGLYPRLDNFDDSYLAKIRARLSSLTSDATEKANRYYQSRLIPNTISLAVQSLNSPTVSVKDSFEFVLNYIDYLKNFIIEEGNDDDSMIKVIPAIENAYNRFSKILKTYDQLDKLKKLDSRSPQYNKMVNDAYSEIVNTVYNEFEMSIQHDGYVVSSLNDFISTEYRLRLKKGIGLGELEKQFLISSSQDLLDTIKSAQFTNKTDILTDLSNANIINLKNLEALDSVFFDSFFNRIQILNQKIMNKDLSQRSLNILANNTAYLDAHSNILNIENPTLMSWCGKAGNWAKTLCARILHPDRYVGEHSLDASTQTTGDTYNKDNERRRNILCMQSLALVSRRSRFSSDKSLVTEARPEKGLCDDVKLVSDYWKDVPTKHQNEFANLNSFYRPILAATQKPISLTNSLEMQQLANDRAICAYRNYRRNNMVYWMTKDLDSRVSTPALNQIIEARKNSDLRD